MSERQTRYSEQETTEEIDREIVIDLDTVPSGVLADFEEAQRRGLTLADMHYFLPLLTSDALSTDELRAMPLPEIREIMQAIKTQVGGAIPKVNGMRSLSGSKCTTGQRPPRGRNSSS